MTAIPRPAAAPRHILLATDLSARCDRALDRAAQLAGEWQAGLVALNVLNATASPDQALAWATGAGDEPFLHATRRQLARDLRAVKVPVKTRIGRGDATAAIRGAAADEQAGLVVTGVSRNETLGRILLGSTVENLARALPVPLLVVHERAHEPYRRIVVAVDFSESSRQALLAAAQFFPGRELIVYHAHPAPMTGLADASVHPGMRPGMRTGIEESECAAFLAATPLPEGTMVRTVLDYGAIEATLTRYVREHEVDLVAIGSHGRSGIMSLLLGSTAAKLLDWLPCDTLLVPDPRARN